MRKLTCLLLIGLICFSCKNESSSGGVPNEEESEKPAGIEGVVIHESSHDVEKAAKSLLEELSGEKYSNGNIYQFSFLYDLQEEDRIERFSALQKYLRGGKRWECHFTLVNLRDGKEDAAEVYLVSEKKDYVVFYFGKLPDAGWMPGAFEFPGLTIQAHGEVGYTDYILSNIEESKLHAIPQSQKSRIEGDGSYYVE